MYRCATSSPTMLLKTQHIERELQQPTRPAQKPAFNRDEYRLLKSRMLPFVMCGMAMITRLGAKVRALRKQRSLTLREVADVVGVHYTHIQKIEAGRKRPSSDVILKFAQLFGVIADQLMRDDLDATGSGDGGEAQPK